MGRSSNQWGFCFRVSRLRKAMAIICQLFMFGDSSEQINQCWLHHCSKYVENHVLETRMNPNIYCYFSNTNKHKQYFSNHNMWKEKKWPREQIGGSPEPSFLSRTVAIHQQQNGGLTSFNHLRTNNTTIKQAMHGYIYIGSPLNEQHHSPERPRLDLWLCTLPVNYTIR